MEKELVDNYQVQDALQQSQIDAQQQAYAPQLVDQVQQGQAVLVAQTDPKKIVKEIILRLRGLEERPDGTKVKVAAAKMNQKGIDNVWYYLDSHINDNIRFSHFKDFEIRKMMSNIQNDLVDDLSLNWKAYGITNKTDLDTINNSILINIYSIFKRAEGQGEKNWIGKISVENISSNTRPLMQKKEGFLSKLRL